MIKLIRLLWHFVVGSILLLFLPGAAVALWEAVKTLLSHPHALIIAAGGVAGVCLDRFLAPRAPVIEVFEHELTHALVGLPLGYIPYWFVATRRGGYVKQICLLGFLAPLTATFVTLAPYFLPTFTVFAVVARPWVDIQWLPLYDGWTGLILGWHTESTRKEIFTRGDDPMGETRGFQPDIWMSGVIFSAVYILVMGVAVHGALFAALTDGVTGLEAWWRTIREVTSSLVSEIPGDLVRLRGLRFLAK
jgi:hypothetical protein